MQTSLKVSESGAHFLKQTAAEVMQVKIEAETERKMRDEKEAKRKSELQRQQVIEQAKEAFRIKNLKKDMVKAFQRVPTEDAESEPKITPSVLLNLAKQKRYPSEVLLSPFEKCVKYGGKNQDRISPSHKLSMNFRNLENSNYESEGCFELDRTPVGFALQSILEANSMDSPYFTKSMRITNKARRQDSIRSPQISDFKSSEIVLQESIADLKRKSEEQGEKIAGQVSARLEKFEKLDRRYLSENCSTEMSQLQKLGHMFQKYSLSEQIYQKRLETEKNGREKLSERRVTATHIIKRIDKVGNEFDHLGSTLGFSCRGKIPPCMVKETLRHLKNTSQHSSEKPIHNSRVKTELSRSSQHLQGSLSQQESPILRQGSPLNLPLLSPRTFECSITKSLLYK